MDCVEPVSADKTFQDHQWSVVIIVLAVIELVFIRLFARGLSELLSLDLSQIINTSIQLHAIINPLSALPTFMVYTERIAKA